MSEIIIYEENCKECAENDKVIIEPVEISTRKNITSQLLYNKITNYTILDCVDKKNLCHNVRTSAEIELSKTNGVMFSRLRFF